MPAIRSLASECYAYIVLLILSLSIIMPLCSYYAEKKLVYIIIAASSSRQSSSCSKCIKLNIYSSYNIKSVSNTKYTFFIYLCNL